MSSERVNGGIALPRSLSENQVRKKKIFKSPSRVIILGEGRDEWGHRFFKFAVHGSETNIPPFSAQQIMDHPNVVFGELVDAGANAFQTSVRIPTIPARDSNLKAATIPIEGGQYCPSARSWGHSAGEASRPDRLAAIFRMLSPFNVSR
jgi:hypothetical protein